MGLALLGLGAFSLYDAFLIFQDGALGATPVHEHWLYIAATVALFIYLFCCEHDEWTEHLGFGVAMLAVLIDTIPRLFYMVFPKEGGFSFAGLFILVLPVLLIAFLILKDKAFSPVFTEFDKGDEFSIFTSMWFIYTCGLLLLYSAMHYSVSARSCPTFILNIMADFEEPVSLSNIAEWPLLIKIILGVTVFAFLSSVIANFTNKKLKDKGLACFEELSVAIIMVYILKILLFIVENAFSGVDFLIWIVLDIFIVLAPIALFFPNTFRAYTSITSGIADSLFDTVEKDDEIKKILDARERRMNSILGKGNFTNEELLVRGLKSSRIHADDVLRRKEQRKKLEKQMHKR